MTINPKSAAGGRGRTGMVLRLGPQNYIYRSNFSKSSFDFH